MCAVRLGSYSIEATLAGTPSLRRLKSMMRYLRLAPPPRWREVMRPYELRPPLFVSPWTSDFSGSLRVTSARSDQVAKRRPGLVGLCFLMAIATRSAPQELNRGRENRARQGSRERRVLRTRATDDAGRRRF